MPRKTSRKEDEDGVVMDSLGGTASSRRNPKRTTSPAVAYAGLHGGAEEEGDDDNAERTPEGQDMEADDEDGDDDVADDELLADSGEDELPARRTLRKRPSRKSPVDDDNEDDDTMDNESDDDAPSRRPSRSCQKRKSSTRKDDSFKSSPPRKSSRSNKFTNSMAEPTESAGLVLESLPAAEDGKEKVDEKSEGDTVPDSPTKSPIRRHAKKRLSLQAEGLVGGDDDDYSSEDDLASDGEDEADEEPIKIQRIIASRTEKKSKWKEIFQKINTSEIDCGSRWMQADKKDAEDVFEERFLIKWSDLGYLHCSWESRKDLIDQVEGANTYFSTFFRKSQDGYLFSSDERNDGDYFDPAITQVDRILEVSWPDGFKKKTADEEEGLKLEDVGVVMDKADDEGLGRQFLIKWGNTPYAEATYEFERDLIFCEVDYKAQVTGFLRRNTRPPKNARNEASRKGETGKRELSLVFSEKIKRDDTEHQVAAEQYQKKLQQIVFKNGGQLRDYQAEGVAWMLSNYVNSRSSILADEMGLGKTLQTVTVVNTIATQVSLSGVFLVIAPLSTLPHWLREFESWSDLNAIVYHGSADDRVYIRQYEMAFEDDRPSSVAFNSSYLRKCLPKKKSKSESPWMVQVIITTPEMLVAEDASELMAIDYEMIIVDEAHRMKNRNSKLAAILRDSRFSFGHKMLLTGTPIQNNISEFWTLLNFCDEDNYDDLDEFLEKYGDMKDKESVDKLHEEIRPYILRRLKEDVEKSVPPKEETLIEVELTIPQKQYYRALYEKNVKFLYKNKGRALDGPSLNNLAMQLRKCCNHVCLLNGVEEELRRETPNLSEADFLVKGSGKLVLLDKLLPRLKQEGHRVLLFSQFKIMLDLIEDYLISRGMKMERIDGSITGMKRQQAIDRFQAKDAPKGSEPPFIMLLSTRAGGQGITLTAADTCIIFDSDWNPQNDLQAQARCHRIGQTSEVKVYRLISAKSYEMQMFHLSSLKMGLDQAVLKGFETGGANDGGMSKEEVERLLKHGAYDILNEEKAGTAEAASTEFIKQDIDSILAGRSRTVIHDNTGSQSGAGGGTFSKASFQVSKTPSGKDKGDQIEVDDPNFWVKILGDKHLKDERDDLASKKRQRTQTNYSEDAYKQQFEATLTVVDEASDDDSATDSNDDDGDDQLGRVRWGISKEDDWDKAEADAFSDFIVAFGYGNTDWTEVASGLNLRQKSRDEVKRMAFSMLLYCVVEAAEAELATSKRREDRLAEKLKGETGNADQTDAKPAPGVTDGELAVQAFRKFWDPNADWVTKLVMEVVVYAKDHDPRNEETLMQLMHKKTKSMDEGGVKILFAKNVWPSLRSRGWKARVAEGGSSEPQYAYEGKEYGTIAEVLRVAREHHSELIEVIDSVSEAVANIRKQSAEARVESRDRILALSPSNASVERLHEVLERYAPAQLLVDRRKSQSQIRLTRRHISSCSLMSSAFDMIEKANSMFESGSLVEKISKSLQIDRRSALPHPKWTSQHDAVLMYVITKHGWLESDANVHAMKEDKAIEWGPPFDGSAKKSNAADQQKNPPAMIEAVAYRACSFLNENERLLNDGKTFNPVALIRTYWLSKTRPASMGDTLADTTPHEESFSVNIAALLQEESAEGSELVELPTRKELQKRAKTLLNRASIAKGKTSPEGITGTQDHPYTVLDQRNACNTFLAQLVRGMIKAPNASDLYKTLVKLSMEEIKARKMDIETVAPKPDTPGWEQWEQQLKDLQSIHNDIDMAKRSMGKSVRLGKNVLRAILGEEPVQPKTPNEPLYPVIKARLKTVPMKKSIVAPKLSKTAAKRSANLKLSLAEAVILEARKKSLTGKSKTATCMELTDVETLILLSACSFGIPIVTNNWRIRLGSSLKEGGLTWVGFGRLLTVIAKANMEEAATKQRKATNDYESLELRPTIELEKRNTIEQTLWTADRLYDNAEVAFGQATDYASEPETLGKKVIMTLAKTLVSTDKRPISTDAGAGVGVWKWLSTQIKDWAHELELLDANQEILAYTAVDFMQGLSETERATVRTVASFDSASCGHVFGQISLVSRLRNLLSKYDGDSLHAHVQHAVLNISEVWPDRPSWWSNTSGLHDVLLLQRLFHEGFESLLQTKASYNILALHAQASYKAAGITKSALQSRARQLVQELHKLEDPARPRSFLVPLAGTAKVSMIRSQEIIAIDDDDKPAGKKARVST